MWGIAFATFLLAACVQAGSSDYVCTAINQQAGLDTWCQTNCFDGSGVFAPACDPAVDLAYRTCTCTLPACTASDWNCPTSCPAACGTTFDGVCNFVGTKPCVEGATTYSAGSTKPWSCTGPLCACTANDWSCPTSCPAACGTTYQGVCNFVGAKPCFCVATATTYGPGSTKPWSCFGGPCVQSVYTCTAINNQPIITSWCQQNCFDGNGVFAPACDPAVDIAYRTCNCVGGADLKQEVAAAAPVSSLPAALIGVVAVSAFFAGIGLAAAVVVVVVFVVKRKHAHSESVSLAAVQMA